MVKVNVVNQQVLITLDEADAEKLALRLENQFDLDYEQDTDAAFRLENAILTILED
jgi:hypothetical protein